MSVIGWLLVASFACQTAPTTTLRADAQAACAASPAGAREWCVLAWLRDQAHASEGGLAGQEIVAHCDTLQEVAVIDQCLELAVGATTPAPDQTCAAINDPRLRGACWLTVADRNRRNDSPLAQVLDDCELVGPLALYCLTHVIQARISYWEAGDQFDADTELAAIISRFPIAADSGIVAVALQLAGTRPGSPDGLLERMCSALVPTRQSECLSTAPKGDICLDTAGSGTAASSCAEGMLMGPPLPKQAPE